MNEIILEHHGIKGQKWGIRRYQNPDGSLTTAGKKRQRKKEHKPSRRSRLAKAFESFSDAMENVDWNEVRKETIKMQQKKSLENARKTFIKDLDSMQNKNDIAEVIRRSKLYDMEIEEINNKYSKQMALYK